MRALANRITLIICLLLAACSQQPSLKDIQGKTINLASYKGKWVLINYWASWCKPCYKEIPELNAFSQRYSDNAVVLGVSYDRVPLPNLVKLAKKLGVKFPTLASDPAKQLGIDNVPGLPATYVIGPNGKLRQRLLGIQTEATLAAAIGQTGR